MRAQVISYTQPNPLFLYNTRPSDLNYLYDCEGEFTDNLIEYAGRVCYKSTAKMGKSPTFIPKRINEGHMDIVEHASATLSIWQRDSDYNFDFRDYSRHFEYTEHYNGYEYVTGNLRVWYELLSDMPSLRTALVPYLVLVAPKVFSEHAVGSHLSGVNNPDQSHLKRHLIKPYWTNSGAMVALLGFNRQKVGRWYYTEDHGHATFLIDGVSRALTHQLVRHRLGSYSQESQRYVQYLKDGDGGLVIPPKVKENKDAMNFHLEVEEMFESIYLSMREMGMRKEDARFYLPNAAKTRIVVTMNLKAWKHFVHLRALDKAAQWEIREVGVKILDLLYAVFPMTFEDEIKESNRIRRDAGEFIPDFWAEGESVNG